MFENPTQKRREDEGNIYVMQQLLLYCKKGKIPHSLTPFPQKKEMWWPTSVNTPQDIKNEYDLSKYCDGHTKDKCDLKRCGWTDQCIPVGVVVDENDGSFIVDTGSSLASLTTKFCDSNNIVENKNRVLHTRVRERCQRHRLSVQVLIQTLGH